MVEYHVHEFPPCPEDCDCRTGAIMPHSTLDFHPADCDMSLGGLVRPMTPEEQAELGAHLSRKGRQA